MLSTVFLCIFFAIRGFLFWKMQIPVLEIYLNHSINVYVISYNRLTVLRKSISSLLMLLPASSLIIIDNGSDYIPLLTYLDFLKERGYLIYYNTKLENPNELSQISAIIEKHKQIKPCDYYVVTDPDIDLDGVSPAFFHIAAGFLNRYKTIDTVGPMLRIDDIPHGYYAREQVLKSHIKQFWSKIPQKTYIDGTLVYYQFALIDTTFGMIRSNTTFRRLLSGIRLYHPYDAKHLDWYITPSTIKMDQRNFIKTSNGNISHWGIPSIATMMERDTPTFSYWIYSVKTESDGSLKVIRLHIP